MPRLPSGREATPAAAARVAVRKNVCRLYLFQGKHYALCREIAQAELELAIHHLKQVEERVSLQREKIARMAAGGLSSEAEEARLRTLLRSLESLKTLVDVIDPVKG